MAGGSTDLEIVGLSLRADDYPNVYVGLQKYGTSGMLSTGAMTIDENTWSSSFTINGVAIIAPDGTEPTGTDFVKNLIQTKCGTSGFQCIDFVKGPFSAFGEPYSRTPLNNQLLGANLVQPGLQSDFYITLPVLHVAPDGIHGIDPTLVPGPLPILGASTAYAFARRLRKRTRLASTAS